MLPPICSWKISIPTIHNTCYTGITNFNPEKEMFTIDLPAQIFPVREAETLASDLNSEEAENGWTYKVKKTRKGLAKIAVYDETGTLAGYL